MATKAAQLNDQRTCCICGKVLVRAGYEKPYAFRARKTCGGSCRATLQWQTVHRHQPPLPVRACRVCGTTLVQGKREKVVEFTKRTMCKRSQNPDCRRSVRVAQLRDSNAERNAKMAAWDHITTIERSLYLALQGLGVRFIKQKRFGHFTVDAYLPDHRTIVEAYGDYWHVGPARYPDPSMLTERQRLKRRKDAERVAVLEATGNRVVIFWESDINSRGADALLREALALPTASGGAGDGH